MQRILLPTHTVPYYYILPEQLPLIVCFFKKKSTLFWAAKKIAMLDYFHDPGWPANSGVQTVPNKCIKMVR